MASDRSPLPIKYVGGNFVRFAREFFRNANDGRNPYVSARMMHKRLTLIFIAGVKHVSHISLEELYNDRRDIFFFGVPDVKIKHRRHCEWRIRIVRWYATREIVEVNSKRRITTARRETALPLCIPFPLTGNKKKLFRIWEFLCFPLPTRQVIFIVFSNGYGRITSDGFGFVVAASCSLLG